MRLFVCYIPGLDVRRIGPETTPHIHAMRTTFPTASLSTLPSVELLPTLLTGVYPRAHGVWQVRLRADIDRRARRTFFERMPASLSTTLQGLRQLGDATFDLATVPPHRRKQFEQFRFKYTRRETTDETLIRFGRYDTILGMLGPRARYSFAKRFDKAHELLDGSFLGGDESLLFLELYALDLFQHWHLDRPSRMAWALSETDTFVRRLDALCTRHARRLALLVDHGQEPVVGSIPLRQTLERSGVPDEDYSFFMEVAQCRFWFHTEGARESIHAALDSLSHVSRHRYTELTPFHLDFEDTEWGETYLLAEPGYIFFPHDFYHPIANAYLGLSDSYQRPRIWSPRHRGNHGYLPAHPSERGFMTLADDAYELMREEGELVDVAPTILELVGEQVPAHMHGWRLFAR